MKKAPILKLFSLVAFAAAGAFAVANAKTEKKVEKAEAAGTTATFYINHFDGGGYWNNFSYYLFNDSTGAKNAEFPGVAFSDDMKTATPNEFDQYQYVLTIDTSVYEKLILVGNPNNWSGSQAQTDDLVIADMSNNGVYCGNQKPDSNHFEVGYYGYSTKSVYLLDLKGDVYNTKHYCHTFATGKSGTAWPGVEMTKVTGSKNLYKAEINSSLDNVIFNNNGSNQTDTIPDVAADNTYIVYPDNGYNLVTLQAASFVDSFMKFETVWLDASGTGLCKSQGWYSDAETAFTGKTPEQKTEILAHEPTAYRLAAWAAANGKTLNTTTGAISPSNFITVESTDSSNLIMIVSIVSLISASTLVGLIVIKRRRGIAK